jgi:hypothetical protein
LFSIGKVARAANVKKPAVLNWVHRGITSHTGTSPANGTPRDIPLLGCYEIGFIATLALNGFRPSNAAALFQQLRETAPDAIHDRELGNPLYLIVASELNPPFVNVRRGWLAASDHARDLATIIKVIVNLSGLFAGIDRALHRECRITERDDP